MHRFQEQVASQGRMLSAIEDGIYNCSPFTLQQKKVYMIFLSSIQFTGCDVTE